MKAQGPRRIDLVWKHIHSDVFVLTVIVVIGARLRLHNLSSYLIYPDSYQSLLVAHNLNHYHQVLDFLGPQGLLYPDFFGWTRPVYSLLIDLFELVWRNPIIAGQITAAIAGIAAIPVAYLLGRRLFDRKAGLVAAGLLAVSANHAVWGGFVLTETTGVLVMLLFLWSLLTPTRASGKVGDWRDGLSGALLGLAILTRYEYAAIGLISIWWLLSNPRGWRRLANLAIGLFLTSAASSWLFRGVLQDPQRVTSSLLPYTLPGVIAIGAWAVLWLWQRRAPRRWNDIVAKIAVAFTWLFFAAIVLQAIFSLHPLVNLSAPAGFFKLDFFIGAAALIGLTLMLLGTEYRRLTTLCLASMALLALVYYRVNPDMQRYWTHLLPFILVPATFGLIETVKWLGRSTQTLKIVGSIIIVAALIGQISVSYRGIHAWSNGIWFQPGYEQQAAKYVHQHFPDNSQVLIASMPEPYFLYTGRSTRSLSQSPPYLQFNDQPNIIAPGTQLLIIEDDGMRLLFPQFAAQLDQKAQPYLVDQTTINTPLRYRTTIYQQTKPLKVYKVDLKTLQYLLH